MQAASLYHTLSTMLTIYLTTGPSKGATHKDQSPYSHEPKKTFKLVTLGILAQPWRAEEEGPLLPSLLTEAAPLRRRPQDEWGSFIAAFTPFPGRAFVTQMS